MAKLQRAAVGETFLNFLGSFLDPWTGRVLVQGAASDAFDILNSVYQGTVLGPPLWNTFFADVDEAARSTGGQEKKFADDLSAFQMFDSSEPPEACNAALEKCKENVHKWGTRNRVTFDAAKEHMIILHPTRPHGWMPNCPRLTYANDG